MESNLSFSHYVEINRALFRRVGVYFDVKTPSMLLITPDNHANEYAPYAGKRSVLLIRSYENYAQKHVLSISPVPLSCLNTSALQVEIKFLLLFIFLVI